MNKRILTGIAAIAASVAFEAAAMSLADASGKIAEVVGNPSAMAETIKQLAPSDQTAFLAKVNAAIDALPGSAEEKAAKYLDANKAALKAVSKENLAAMLAETFATVPPEALTVINERFAADLFNRAADPANPVSDETMKNLAVETMKTIQARNEGNNNAGVRDTFAILMFLRASNGTPADLRDTLVAGLPDAESRELAKTDWIPAAMGDGREKSYEPILAASDAGKMPDFPETFGLMATLNPTFSGVLLADLASAVDESGRAGTVFTDATRLDPAEYALPFDTTDVGLNTRPKTLNPDAPYYSGYRRGGGTKGSNNASGEADTYANQTTR